jgi:Reverse transcriptase (RNA-dependent DNA polymerase)
MMSRNRFAPLCGDNDDVDEANEEPFDVALVGAADGVVADTNQLRVMKYKEAMQTDKKGWTASVDDEYQRMVDNEVFKIIHCKDVPRGRKVVSTMWAMKQNVNGVKRARLVARGFEQVLGQDYDPQGGRYAPVVTVIVFKIVCVLIVMMEMFAHIADVRGAFLTGDLSDSPVYIEVPEEIEKKVKETADAEAKAKGVAPMSLTNIVLMLHKSLYGLVQSSHLFWRKQSKVMMDELKLERSIVDYCLYYKWIGDKLFADLSVIEEKKKVLTKTFEIDDVGPMKEYVGCKIEHDQASARIKFTQPILIQSFGDEFTLPPKKTGGTPAAPGTILQAYEHEPMLPEKEQSVFHWKSVGKLWFLARILRHEILHAVRDASKFSAGAWTTSMNYVLRILKYCAETPERGLLFKPKRKWTGRDFEFDLKGYSDSNYAANPDNHRSVMSCQVFLEDCCISAKSKQMPFVTLSVTEAELAAAVECVQDMLYVMHVMEGMGLKVKMPMPLYVDNKAAVNMVKNWISGGCTRHTLCG